jgi:hypothetical protein
MEKPLLVIAAVWALGLVYVVFPAMLDAFMRYRKSRRVACPEKQKAAVVKMDAPAAAFAAVQGKTRLQIRGCSLWPEKEGCNQSCLAQMV